MTSIGIFAATRWELNAVLQALTGCELRSIEGIRCWVGRSGRAQCLVIKTGIGPRKASVVGRRVVQRVPLSAIISTGFACALQDARIGDLLIGTEVVGAPNTDSAPPLPCSAEWVGRAIRVAEDSTMPASAGRFISVPHVLCSGHEKRVLAQTTGAMAVDMESAALAVVAGEAGLPFTIVRTVSDLKDEDLPLDFNLFLRPIGWIAGVTACLSRPTSIAGLSRLRDQSRRAAEQLTRFHARYLSAVPAVAMAGR